MERERIAMLGHSYIEYRTQQTNKEIAELKRRLSKYKTEPYANVLLAGQQKKLNESLCHVRVSGATVLTATDSREVNFST